MSIVTIILGILWVLCGIAFKFKKWLWIHQGIIKRPVDVNRYTDYMGIVDIAAGICYIIAGIIDYFYQVPEETFFLIFIITCCFVIHGEFKYRIRS